MVAGRRAGGWRVAGGSELGLAITLLCTLHPRRCAPPLRLADLFKGEKLGEQGSRIVAPFNADLSQQVRVAPCWLRAQAQERSGRAASAAGAGWQGSRARCCLVASRSLGMNM